MIIVFDVTSCVYHVQNLLPKCHLFSTSENPYLEVLAIVISQFLSRIGLINRWLVPFGMGYFRSDLLVSGRVIIQNLCVSGKKVRISKFQVENLLHDISLILTTNGWPFPPMFPNVLFENQLATEKKLTLSTWVILAFLSHVLIKQTRRYCSLDQHAFSKSVPWTFDLR